MIRAALLLLLALATAPWGAAADLDLADIFAKTSPSVVTLTTYSAAGVKLG